MIDDMGVENIRAIEANWLYGSNLTAFRKNIAAKITPEAAAQGTWTGEMARRLGFTKAEVVKSGQAVKVIFTRPQP